MSERLLETAVFFNVCLLSSRTLVRTNIAIVSDEFTLPAHGYLKEKVLSKGCRLTGSRADGNHQQET